MSIVEAVKGCKMQVASTQGVVEKLRLTLSLSRIIIEETVGGLCRIPYGVKAWSWYRSCRPSHNTDSRALVSIRKNIQYCGKRSCVLDIYSTIPLTAEEKRPVALFCHGGVWASGDKWHYAPLAKSLSRSGIITCVMTHSLFPNAHMQEMADEISQALDWVLENIERHGGSAEQVSLVGHSSGAHLCMLSLLNRAINAGQGGNQGQNMRMPRQFLGICGVYNLGSHFEYEKQRGVHWLSTMERAVGGYENLPKFSPLSLVRTSLSTGNTLKREVNNDAIRNLPPVVLFASDKDFIVPSVQSLDMSATLHEMGVKTTLRKHDSMTHSDFVLDWPTHQEEVDSNTSTENEPRFHSELVEVLLSSTE